MFVGRAEAVLAAAVSRPSASAAQQRLYAETLQYRHDFSAAEALLGTVLRTAPSDAAARAQRASLRLVRGDFAGARADCAHLLAGGGAGQAIALACLAQVHAASNRLDQGRALLAAYPAPPARDAALLAYWLTVRGEMFERGSELDRAIADYRAALALAPENDSIRATLADALLARGERHEARELLNVERPGLALLVRRAACADGAEREALRAQAAAWLALEAARGDSIHAREAAMLALDGGDAVAALASAQANFRAQKELTDVRLLARTAIAAHDARARQQLAEWLRSTGYRDAMTENILDAAASG
jgi:thioredoxin-like negative regulator of GroEL